MAFNWNKYKEEIPEYWEAWMNGDDTVLHRGGEWTNRFVEGARASPYIAGHLDAIFLVPGIITVLGLLFLLGKFLWGLV